MKIAELIAELGFDLKGEADLRRFEDGMRRAEVGLVGFVGKIEQFGKAAVLGISAIGVGIGATVAGMFKLASDASKPLDDLLKFSNRVGGSIEELQQWQYAAGLAGASSGEFQTSVISMTRQLAEAARGTGRAKKALADYGLSAKDAKGKIKEPTAFLMELSDKFQKLSDAKQLDLGTKLGLSPGMITLLKSGRAEIEKVQKQVRDNGLIFTEEDAKRSEAYNDQMTLFQETIKALRWRIGVQLMPVLTEMMDRFQSWYTANEALIRQNVGLWTKRVITGLETALGSLGRLWWALGKIADGIGDLLKKLTGEKIDVSKLHALAGIVAILLRLFAPLGFWLTVAYLALDEFLGYLRGDQSYLGDFIKWIQDMTGASEGLAQALAGIVASLGLLALMKPGALLKGLGRMIGVGGGNPASPTTAPPTSNAPSTPPVAPGGGGWMNALGLSTLTGFWATLVQGLGDTPGDTFEKQVANQKKSRQALQRLFGIEDDEKTPESRHEALTPGRRDVGEIERDRALDDFVAGPKIESPTIKANVEPVTIKPVVDPGFDWKRFFLGDAADPDFSLRDHLKMDVGGKEKGEKEVSGILAAGSAIAEALGKAAKFIGASIVSPAGASEMPAKGDRVAPQEPDPARFGGEVRPVVGLDELRAIMANVDGAMASMNAARSGQSVQPVINDSRQDNRNQSVVVNSTVNQTVTQASQAPDAAARATGNAVGQAATQRAGRLEVSPAF